MKKPFHVPFLTLIALFSLLGTTAYPSHINVSGTISVNTTWSGVDTVFITGDDTVNNGITLTIHQGMMVVSRGHYKISVKGRLQAVGTTTQPITFTVSDTTGYYNHTHMGWGGLVFSETPVTNDTSRIVYCRLFFGKAFPGSAPESERGGAMYIAGFDKVVINHCTMAYNYSSLFGGAVYFEGATRLTISNCLIHDNYCNGDGGFLYTWNKIILHNNIITGNRAISGGAIYFLMGSAELVNNVISGNMASQYGGAMNFMNANDLLILNNTFCNNQANMGGGIFFNNQAATITNSIIHGNMANGGGSQIYFNGSANAHFIHCNVDGWATGFGGGAFSGQFTSCLNLDPHFSNISPHPYSLLRNSPCINTGDPATTITQAGKYDASGNSRIFNGIVDCIDIGAYEFQGNPEPVVTRKLPWNNQDLINPATELKLTFNAPVMAGTGYISIIRASDNFLFERIQAGDTARVTVDSNIVFVDPTLDFMGNTQYYVLIDSLAFESHDDQKFKGFNTPTSWHFSITATDHLPVTALAFNGTGNYVEIPDNDTLDLTGHYTLEAWIKPASFGLLKGIISKYQSSGANGYILRLQSNSPYTGLNFDGMNTQNGLLTANRWYHVAAVNDNGKRRLYLNGEMKILSGTPSPVVANSDPLRIGVDFGNRYFNGLIDEVRLWNRARSAEEIRESIYLPLEGTEPGLVSYWQCNEATGTVVTDRVGHRQGALKNQSGADWSVSSIPFGPGNACTRVVSAPGTVAFQDEGLWMDITAQTGHDTLVVTRLNACPNFLPATVDTVYDAQYWILNKYGTGVITAGMTFALQEDFTPQDQFYPEHIKLYNRQSVSLDDWSLVTTAVSVDATANTVTFSGITGQGQFVIGRHQGTKPPQVIALSPPTGGSIPQTGHFKVIFDHPVWEVSGKALHLYHACTGALLETYSLPSPHVTGNGTDTITITPQATFLPGVKGYLLIDEGAFINQAGIEFTGFGDPEDWNFRAEVKGHISADAIWCDSLLVTGDVIVDNGKTLDIIPGTCVNFQGHYKLDVQGRLLAVGAVNKGIRFTGYTSGSKGLTSVEWNRITFNQTPASNDTSKLVHCLFEHGNASQGSIFDKSGGALFVYSFHKLLVSNCIFQNNNAGNQGGAAYFYQSTALLRNNVFSNNGAQEGGAIFSINESHIDFVNNAFYNNLGLENGGAAHIMGGSTSFLNCTFYGNNTGYPGYGGALYLYSASPVFKNCILYGNKVSTTFNQVYLETDASDPVFTYCDIQGGKDGFTGSGAGVHYTGQYVNNLDVDPLFIKGGDHPCMLRKTSPCANTGDPATTTAEAGTKDLAGGRRIVGGRIDMGAYENDYHTDSFIGSALVFDGLDDKVELINTTGFSFGSTFTIESWFKLENMSYGFHTLASKGNEWIVKLFVDATTAIIEFGINRNAVFAVYVTHPDSLLNRWNHLACVNGINSSDNKIKIYLNGIEGMSNPAQVVTTGSDPVRIGESFRGAIDEFRIWSTNRPADEIRRSMHLVMQSTELHLSTYLQFNEAEGALVRDAVGGNDGILYHMNLQQCWIPSTVAAGRGCSVVQEVSSPGTFAFPNTGMSIRFTEKSGTDIFVVTKIDTVPNLLPDILTTAFGKQYWIIHRFGSGSFRADLSFSPGEQLTAHDSICPWLLNLCRRESNAETDWTCTGVADSLNIQANEATFNGFTGFSQFLLGRGPGDPDDYPGTALDFSEPAANVSGTGIDTSLTAITLEAWVYHNSLGNTVQRYVTVAPEVAVIRHDGTSYGGYHELHFYIKKANGSGYGLRADSVLCTGEWMHVAGTYDGNTMCLYLNGKLLKSAHTTSNLYPPSGNFLLSHSGEIMYGKMDEIRIWNHARTAQQIRESMYLRLAGNESGLIGYWQMNEGAGTATLDIIRGNSGTLHNMTANCWVPSTLPFGSGSTASVAVADPGYKDFPGTGMSMLVTGKSGEDILVATRLDTTPNIRPAGPDNVFDRQYFILNKYGNGTFLGDFFFTLKEKLEQGDYSHPSNLSLYTRGSNADTSWIKIAAAVYADTSLSVVKFTNINGTGQFMVARETALHTEISLKVFLEGPFNGSQMNTSLNPDYLPHSQPYHVAPWNYTGNESAALIPAEAVDWVLVEPRDAQAPALATAGTAIGRKAVFLLKDGSLRTAEGSGRLLFSPVISDSLYVVVWHRNHLNILSAKGLLKTAGVYDYDYSASAGQAFGGPDGHKQLSPGVWGMFAGDGDADGQIDNEDKVDVWVPQSGSSGYKKGDFDLDGQVDNTDKLDKWKPNSGRSSQVPD